MLEYNAIRSRKPGTRDRRQAQLDWSSGLAQGRPSFLQAFLTSSSISSLKCHFGPGRDQSFAFLFVAKFLPVLDSYLSIGERLDGNRCLSESVEIINDNTTSVSSLKLALSAMKIRRVMIAGKIKKKTAIN